jgi:hypothetical protein
MLLFEQMRRNQILAWRSDGLVCGVGEEDGWVHIRGFVGLTLFLKLKVVIGYAERRREISAY